MASGLTPNTAYDVYVVLVDDLGNRPTSPTKLDVTTLAQPTISINDVSINEGNSGTTSFTFTVNLSVASSQPITVNYATANGTATAGSDYTAITSTGLTFNATETSKMVTVNVSGDTDFESDETFTVNLSSPTNATINTGTGTGTIQNDDAAPPTITSVSIPNAAAKVGDAITVSIVASEAGLTLNAGEVNGVAVTGFTDNGGGNYTATYTVVEGNTDRAAGDNIPVSFILSRGGVNSAAFTTAISQAGDPIDANTPAAPGTIDMTAGTDSGISNSDNITNDVTPTFTGTAEANSTVELFYGGTTSLGTTTASGTGTYTITATTIPEGPQNITARATDAAGNVSAASSALSITIDVTAPAVPSTPDMTAGSDSGPSNSDNITNNATPTFIGTADANTGIELFYGGTTSLGITTANGAGNYAIIASTIPMGPQNITTRATDAAGNLSGFSSALSITIDAMAPTITSVSIPNAAAKVGDAITVTIVAGEAGLSLNTGEVNGVAVTGFTDNGGGNYTATYTVVEGNTDRVAGDNIPVNFILADAAGNNSTAFTTAISQAGDPIDANSPTVTSVSIPNAAAKVGDAITVTIVAGEAGLSLTTGEVNGVAVTSFTDNGGGNYTATYTVVEGNTDRAAGDNIPVNFILADAAGNNSSAFTTAISQAGDPIDANTPTITSVSIPNAGAKVGDAITVTIVASEAGLSLNTGEVNGVAVTGFTDNGGGNYTATYTVVEGNMDRAAGDNIPVNFILSDAAGNTSSAFTTAISQASDPIDANSPSVTSVSIPNAAAKVGDAITVTIVAGEAGLSLNTGEVNGVAVTGFTDNGGGNYTATYTVVEGNTDRAAGDNIPVNFILADAAGNNSTAFTTAISQAGDPIDANSPTVTSVSIPNAAAKVGDVITVTIVAGEAGLSLTTGEVNGVAVTGFTDNGGGNYTATYTVVEGNTDRAAGDNIPVNFILTDAAGNNSTAFTTAISQASDPIDANTPTITSVSIPNAGAKVGDAITVTIVASEAGLSLNTGEVNGVAVTSFTDNGGGNYTTTYTVVEGNTDRAAGDNIPVNFILSDAAGNTSSAFTTAISQAGDPIDANSPTVTSVSIPNAAAKVGDAIMVTIVAGEAGLSLNTGEVNGVAVTGFTDNGGGNYTATYTVVEGNTDRAAGDNIPVNFILADAAGNNSTAFTTAISQAGDPIDANSPTVTSVSIPNAAAKVGDAITVTIVAGEAGLSLTTGEVNSVAVTSFTDNGGGNYTATYTVVEGNMDRAAGDNIPVNFILADAAGNNSTAFTTAISQAGDPIDANTPTITSVSIPNAGAKVGDAITVTIVASEAGLSLNTGEVNGVAVTGFTDNGGGNYTATYTVVEGNMDRAAGDNIPVNFILSDAAGNTSSAFTTAISQAGDPIDANSPSVTSVSIPNAAAKVGDAITVTIVAGEAGLSLNTGEVNGVAVTGFTDNGGGNYTATYTVVEGNMDRAAGDNIPVNFILADAAGNNSTAFTTAISQAADPIDANSPVVTSVNVPANATYGTGANMDFTVNFGENVSVTGTPQIAITIGTTTRQATYVTGTGSSALVFRYTVQAGDFDNDGIAVGTTIDLNGGTITDVAGNNANTTLNSVASTTLVLVDSGNPTVTSITRDVPTSERTNVDMLTYLVTFNEDVQNVSNDDFEASNTTASISVNQLSASTYEVMLSGGDLASLNATVTLSFSSTQNIEDISSNALLDGTPTGTDESSYTVDNTAPTVVSFTRKTPAAQITNADAITFLATFSEDVQNVDLADFTAIGPTGASIIVTPLTASTYDVQISGGDMAAINGTIGLDLRATASITDLAGNILTVAEPGTDETYTLDNQSPSVVSFTRGNPTTMVTSADQVTFRVSFDTQVINVDAADFEVTGTTATITSVTEASPGLYDVLVSGGDLATLNGTVGLNFAAGVSISDDAGNILTGAAPSPKEDFTLCNGPANPVTSIVLGTATANSIPFTSFTAPAGGATGYVVKINEVNTFTTPTDATTLPTANLTWAGAGEQVIYAGTSATPNITVTGLTSGITYYFKVFAYNDCGGTNTFESTGAEVNTATPKADQTITFALGADATKTFGDAAFNLTGTASSGLTVTYTSSDPAVATVSGNTVTIVGVGSTVITASQAGNTNFNAAPDVTQTLTVNKADQTITFDLGTDANKTVGDANFTLTGTASSGLTVTYTSSNTAVATVSGSTVTIVGPGTTDITASQAGNANYNAAADVVQTLTVADAPIMSVTQGTTTLASGTGSYSFGNVDINQSSSLITFTITNSGGADLQLSGSPVVAVSGTNSSEFTITQPTGTTVAPGSNTTFQVVFTPTAAGTRTATISIANNSATNPYTFTINGEAAFAANNLAAPNLFTPNGDGSNDVFLISAPTLATVSLKIYNRKGAVVFSSNNVNEVTQNGWNGELNGQKLPTGTYIWQIRGTYQDGTAVKTQTGEVYLVR